MLHNVMISEKCLFQIGKARTPDINTQRRRLTKAPIVYRDKLNTLSDDLQKNGIMKQIGSMPPETPSYGSNFLNRMIIIKKE